MAESAPTRRSSRTSATPVQAPSETLGASRAELRRRAAAASVVEVSHAGEPKQKDAVAEPVSPVIVLEPEAAVTVQPITDLPAAPLSRRARRAPVTAEQPAVVEPPIAPVAPADEVRPEPEFRAELPTAAAPAPLLETVLAPAEPFELLEPVLAEVLEPVLDDAMDAEAAADAASGVDEFEAAARLFCFTGETPIQAAASEPVAESVADDAEAETVAAHHVPRKRRVPSFKRMTAASFSVGVMGIVGLMAVGMTTPAQAVAAAGGAEAAMSIIAPVEGTAAAIDKDEIQAYVAPAEAQPEDLHRSESYDTTTFAEMASQAGIKNFSNLFVNDPTAAIQWPFSVGVTMSYGYGMRSGRMHEGIDFTPGAGAPIQAIAEGTVRVASEAGGAYGVHVIVDHVIDGQLVSSHYAHMQYGSMQVVPGQTVTAGTVLGKTGNTGRSFGAHLHFEVLMNGTTAIDPMPWLRQHAGG
jgi:murein DD-endopeptidase MepM/ murein hydrolase activator NlpD